MTDFNEIPGIRLRQIVGNVVAPAEASRFNDNVQELRLAISQGYRKGEEWVEQKAAYVTLSAVGTYGEALKAYGKGDKVRLEPQEGREDFPLEVRTFERKDGSEGLGLNARFADVVLINKKGEGSGSAPATADWSSPAKVDATPVW